MDAPGSVIGAYDAIDLPPVTPIVTRHQRLQCACRQCGETTKAGLPEAAIGSPFGPNIRVLAVYLKHFQHVSCERLQHVAFNRAAIERKRLAQQRN